MPSPRPTHNSSPREDIYNKVYIQKKGLLGSKAQPPFICAKHPRAIPGTQHNSKKKRTYRPKTKLIIPELARNNHTTHKLMHQIPAAKTMRQAMKEEPTMGASVQNVGPNSKISTKNNEMPCIRVYLRKDKYYRINIHGRNCGARDWAREKISSQRHTQCQVARLFTQCAEEKFQEGERFVHYTSTSEGLSPQAKPSPTPLGMSRPQPTAQQMKGRRFQSGKWACR
jgi:hypothetical protein